MGRRNVYTGKQTTAAVAIGTRIMEDLSSMTAEDVLTNFAIADNTTVGTVTLTGIYGSAQGGQGQVQYTNSLSRDSSACTVNTGTNPATITCTNDPNSYMVNWMRLLIPGNDKNAVFAEPQLGIILTPRLPTDNAKPWTTAKFTKIRAYVSWKESNSRRRYAFFDTTKVIR
jgi:hypothetical protein